ncbi:MAG: hypothetical protein AB7I36_20430 [Rhodospirillaceae bacterium]
MRIIEEGRLDGEFEGFEDTDRVFTFSGSSNRWRQRGYHYHYYYAYMPRARVVERSGRTYLSVDGISTSIEVERA